MSFKINYPQLLYYTDLAATWKISYLFWKAGRGKTVGTCYEKHNMLAVEKGKLANASQLSSFAPSSRCACMFTLTCQLYHSHRCSSKLIIFPPTFSLLCSPTCILLRWCQLSSVLRSANVPVKINRKRNEAAWGEGRRVHYKSRSHCTEWCSIIDLWQKQQHCCDLKERNLL